MRLTKSWWNDKWRDLLLAGMHWIAEGHETINLAAGDETFAMASLPISLETAVSYRGRESRSAEEDDQGEIVLDDELDDESFADDDRAEPENLD
jgi:hypothetical protein